ncbi:MAG TPA: SulP family inorganic anion transporter [Bdellovibrionota bacterium]|nr:SulP family inorganic anion transporter [Bdellovibrionota bacterium]
MKHLIQYVNPFDGRYEDLTRGSVPLNVLRDFTAGLVVAMIAIPLAMGFAMASGLRPEQGIVGGAVAGLIGALFGGSKYQVYGPTAAFIPVVGAIMMKFDGSFLILASIASGTILALMGLARLGRYVSLVPNSIVVGFTIGIACTIAFSQMGEVLGITAKLGYGFADKVRGLASNIDAFNVFALVLALATFTISKILLKISVFIPAPLIALGFGTLLSATLWKDKGISLVKDKFGAIPTDFLVVTMPSLPEVSLYWLGQFAYYVTAIVFVAAVESLLCSRMADRLAGNKGVPFNPDRELWGQGLVNIAVVMLNGFPHTGALARTATNIKVGAVSPLAGIFKCVLKLLLAAYLASYLELVPMACIGGILLYVAFNMVKPAEIREVLKEGRTEIFLMGYTAVMVFVTDFLTGVLTAIILAGAISVLRNRPRRKGLPSRAENHRAA